jgi:UDP-glucose 4-epimerase
MIYLVTGGAGFIGSHLIEALLKKEGAVVVSLDDYSTGSESNHVPGARYIRGSTKDITSLVDVKPDVVFHLGEYPRVEKSFEDIARVWESNKIGTIAVLEFCRTHQCKIIYAGSSTKFGDCGLGRDQSPYAWTKATNTELVRNYGAWFGLPYAITYFYNVYGPGERSGAYGSLIEIFADKFRKGETLGVVAPGTQRRNFTHVEDIVRGLVAVGDRGAGDDYGLGSPEAFSVLEIAQLFGSPIEMLPERKGNRMDAGLDTHRAATEFGWKAEHHVTDYIKKIVAQGLKAL